MRQLEVPVPEAVSGGVPSLGRLGPALQWLARAQGAWPPRVASTVRRVVVDAGTSGDLAAGLRTADELADAGCDLLVAGSDGDPVPGLVVLAALLDLEPVQAVGTSGGAGWAAQATGVRDGLRAVRSHTGDPEGLLEALGSPALSVLTGLLAQSAVRRTPVVLDGSAGTVAAALLAHRLAPGASAWWLAGAVPPAPAARQALTSLSMTGLLDLALALPAGADLARALLEQAVGLVADARG